MPGSIVYPILVRLFYIILDDFFTFVIKCSALKYYKICKEWEIFLRTWTYYTPDYIEIKALSIRVRITVELYSLTRKYPCHISSHRSYVSILRQTEPYSFVWRPETR